MNHDLLVWFSHNEGGRVTFSKTKEGQFIAFLRKPDYPEECLDGIGGTPEDALTDVLAAEREATP